MVTNLIYINPVNFPPYFSRIQSNIILKSTPRSPNAYLRFKSSD